MTNGQKVYHNGKKYRIVVVHGLDTYIIRNKSGEQKLVNRNEMKLPFSFKQLRTKFENFIVWFVELPTIKAIILTTIVIVFFVLCCITYYSVFK